MSEWTFRERGREGGREREGETDSVLGGDPALWEDSGGFYADSAGAAGGVTLEQFMRIRWTQSGILSALHRDARDASPWHGRCPSCTGTWGPVRRQ